MDKPLAQVAYEAFAASLNKSLGFDGVPDWNAIPPMVRQAWEDCVKALTTECENRCEQ